MPLTVLSIMSTCLASFPSLPSIFPLSDVFRGRRKRGVGLVNSRLLYDLICMCFFFFWIFVSGFFFGRNGYSMERRVY